MSEHTPTPWRLKETGNMGSLIEAQSGKKVQEFDDGYRTVASYQDCCASQLYAEQETNRRANGEFIVRAVNAHAQLVAALEQVLQDDREFRCCSSVTLEAIEAALASLKESV